MRARELVVLVVLVILASALFSAAPATAARKTIGLDGQVRSVGFSKAVPGQLNYQGYLVDAADSSAVNATLEMTFRLFDSETKGAELWFEAHPAVDVSNGLFQVLLGSVTVFPAGLFDGTTLWLQTEVEAEVLSPRKPLVSVAYSHRAQDADQLEGETLTDLDGRYVNEDQASSVTSSMITDGEITDDDVAVGAAIDPGKIAGTAWTADNDGAGSGLDADLLDGQQAADFTSVANDFGRSGVSPDLYEGTTTLGDKYVAKADLDHLDAADGDPANAVYVDDAGKVGVGTTSPLTELDVNGSVNATTYYGDGSHLTGIAGTPDADWTISGNDMYSAVSGNVGIGTGTPDYLLDVEGDAGFSQYLYHNEDEDTYIKFTTDQINMYAGGVWLLSADETTQDEVVINEGSVDVDFRVESDNSEYALFVRGSDGNVGIGTTSPVAKLDVETSTGMAAEFSNSDSTYGFTIKVTNSVGTAGQFFSRASGGYSLPAAVAGIGGSGAIGGFFSSSDVEEGLTGQSTGSGNAVWGWALGTGYAGYFSGDVHITGTLTGGKTIIDHPLDPENKLLRHNFVESPENLLIYRGKAQLNASGETVVEMPDYFEALTKESEASIHLTPVGKPFLTGAEWNSGFQSLTVYGEANREVFWEVLADRDDPVIRQLARPVEEEKGPDNRLCNRGELLHPVAYGYPESMGKDYKRQQELEIHEWEEAK